LELIAFGEAGCFGAADAARLLGYCARLLDLYAACAAESLGVDVRAERALLGCWVLGAADAAGTAVNLVALWLISEANHFPAKRS
jgi:hypothetical protein